MTLHLSLKKNDKLYFSENDTEGKYIFGEVRANQDCTLSFKGFEGINIDREAFLTKDPAGLEALLRWRKCSD